MAKPQRYKPAVRERAVRMLLDQEPPHPSRWAALQSISQKSGCTPETLRLWVQCAKIDGGPRQLSLISHDRLLPNQDTMPKGGFGNLQCGPIRHTAAPPASAPHDLEVIPRTRSKPMPLPDDTGIQDIFRTLAEDQERTVANADETQRAVEDGRKVLVLTERTDHLESIRRSMEEHNLEPFVLHGRMSKKQRANLVTEIDALPPDSPQILLATGRLVGDGFDHPPLDTLILAMPVSWKGTLQQYAGRLHREHANKTDIRIID